MSKPPLPMPPPTEDRQESGCLVRLENAVLRYPVGPFIKGSIKSNLLMLFGHQPPEQKLQREYITALDGLNLTVQRGERLGIIGRNGAGKSTLLRAIAGIYGLASGGITVHGKIQSLFDIGLGFEPESTGRENILYRGMSMGCLPEEIVAREEEIIAFADIGEFIDLPVRTYSSGMYVRLAFAISTYLKGDILLIDEIFGAGDASFQKRAVERISNLISAAGIVVVVTHEMGMIEKTCTRAIWLDHGKLRADGDCASVIKQYLDEAG